jgi:pyridoxamine 5'-phosphate oxidase
MDNLKNHIEKLREDFIKGSLNESSANDDPFLLFSLWMQEAVDAQVPEVQAMNLATVSSEHKPSSRTVYLREFENNVFGFYTNYESKKAHDLTTNPNAALTFFWPALERQIRIEGRVEKMNETQSDRYFDSRPQDSKIGAWASKQSSILKSRDDLEQQVIRFKALYGEGPVKRPDYWGGYNLKASYYEFWQGRKSRLHDRIVYTLAAENVWQKGRLSP